MTFLLKELDSIPLNFSSNNIYTDLLLIIMLYVKLRYWNMAGAARLICFSHGKSVKVPCRTSGFTHKERFHRRLVAHFHGIMLLKLQSSCRNSRYSQLIKPNTNYSALKLRCSRQLSRRKERNFSSSSSNERTPKVVLPSRCC